VEFFSYAIGFISLCILDNSFIPKFLMVIYEGNNFDLNKEDKNIFISKFNVS
jgi:hypothetical protein